MNMTANEFAKIVRTGSEKLRVDEITINTGAQELHGKGLLRISRGEIELQMTFNPGEIIPEVQTGIFTKRDYWNLTGVIEDTLRFKCENVGPIGIQQRLLSEGIIRSKFDLHPIDIIPSGWDAMSFEQRKEFLRQQQEKNPGVAMPQLNAKDTASFYATLFEYPLLATKWGTEMTGETDSFEFALKKDEKDSDLNVALHSKKKVDSSSEPEDWVKFYAFMNALAFMTGIHAWPYRIEYWRAGQKITDRITSADKLAKTLHAPFTDRLAFNAKTGSLQWSFQDSIRKAADFFEKDSVLSKESAVILFLFREAGAGVHAEIATIALCALFENLVRTLFRELDLQSITKGEDLKSFEDAKVEIAEQINRQMADRGVGYRRLYNIIRSAEPLNLEQMFRAVASHLGLKWQDDMEKVFETWKLARHPLVHQKRRAEISEDSIKEATIHESRIAGAINILMLKTFSYSGWVRHSTWEDGYRQI